MVDMKKIYANRELSWLKFNERVLEEAARKEVPLCERLNFISIYQSNLDEFFRIRVGSLVDLMQVEPNNRENKTNMTPGEQKAAVMKDVRRLDARKEEIYKGLLKEIKEQGIELVCFDELSYEEQKLVESFFDSRFEPMLSPLIVGKLQPFPFIRNCETHAVAALRKKNSAGKGKNLKLGIVSCHLGGIPRLIRIHENKNKFILSEELILNCLDRIFKNYKVEQSALVRIIRNADIDADSLYDEGIDYRQFMSDLVKYRRHMAPVRLEISKELDKELFSEFFKEIVLDPDEIFVSGIPFDLSFFSNVNNMLRDHTELFYEYRSPQNLSGLPYGKSILEQVKEKDRLLCYPYHSMQTFLSMLREAATDPDVFSIKITLYRVAKNSSVIEHLIEAADNGKDVQVLLELKARFDEENNIFWSQRLEAAGCKVIYGLNGIKVHSKLCLIVKNGKEGPEYFTYIGTGNFNEVTARLYTDFALLTSNRAIGENTAAVFQALAMDETLSKSPYLLVAPKCFRNEVVRLIDTEIEKAKAGREAYIGIKINSLTDKILIDKLVEASSAGVKIDMIVRGICCMNPKVPGKTDNIRVISIVGRFLEHSRLYIFGTEGEDKIYISSADFMTRNMQRRVEAAVPILDKDIQDKLKDMFRIMLKDNRQAWELQADGRYERVENDEALLNSQEYFFQT